jgi:hypothetical protein
MKTIWFVRGTEKDFDGEVLRVIEGAFSSREESQVFLDHGRQAFAESEDWDWERSWVALDETQALIAEVDDAKAQWIEDNEADVE